MWKVADEHPDGVMYAQFVNVRFMRVIWTMVLIHMSNSTYSKKKCVIADEHPVAVVYSQLVYAIHVCDVVIHVCDVDHGAGSVS